MQISNSFRPYGIITEEAEKILPKNKFAKIKEIIINLENF